MIVVLLILGAVVGGEKSLVSCYPDTNTAIVTIITTTKHDNTVQICTTLKAVLFNRCNTNNTKTARRISLTKGPQEPQAGPLGSLGSKEPGHSHSSIGGILPLPIVTNV